MSSSPPPPQSPTVSRKKSRGFSTFCCSFCMSTGADDASFGKGNPADYGCPHCDLSFRRREHLSRHLDRHTGSRPHQCGICMKTFPRNDTLKRHVSIHGPAALADWVHRSSNRHRRACKACAKGKQRCDGNGTTVCSNCASRKRRCLYRTSTSESVNDVVLDETTNMHRVLHDRLGCDPSPVLQSSQEEEIITMVPDDLSTESAADEPRQTSIASIQVSSHPDTDGALLISQLEPLTETPMFFSGSFAPVNAPFAYGFGGIPEFYFGSDDLSNAMFLLPEQRSISSDSLASPLESGYLSSNNSNRQDQFLADDEDTLIAEFVPHVPRVDGETRNYMLKMLTADMPTSDFNHTVETFPSLQYLDVYVQLYFEHFHRRWPVLHVPTFEVSPERWHVVFSVAFIGCQNSEAIQKHKHLALFRQLSPRIFGKASDEIFDSDLLACMQSLLLLQHCMMFDGSRKTFIRLQLNRSVLITLCRKLLSQDGSVLNSHEIAEIPPDPWSQWVRIEAERRVLYFTWMTECLQGILFLIPPLLTIAELQVPLPGPEAHWEADLQQWQQLAPSRPQATVCVALASIGLQGQVPDNFDSSARLITLLSAFVQCTAAQDLMRAMMLYTENSNTTRSASTSGTVADVSRAALDVLCRYGESQFPTMAEPRSISDDFPIIARILTIFDLTPLRLLYSFTRWQSSETGVSNARKELSRILNHQIRQARQCIHQAAQLFQYFRTANTLRHVDTIALLVCTLYIHAYIELVAEQRTDRNEQADVIHRRTMIRVDQASYFSQIGDWLNLEHDHLPHVTGIGVLGADRSVARLYKESSRIMGRSASKSSFAAALQPLLESQAAGNAPALQDK